MLLLRISCVLRIRQVVNRLFTQLDAALLDYGPLLAFILLNLLYEERRLQDLQLR